MPNQTKGHAMTRKPKRVTEWQPIDTAPKDGSVFLGLWRSQNNIQFVSAKKDQKGRGWTDPFELYDYNTKLTHWMPLPEPPKEVK